MRRPYDAGRRDQAGMARCRIVWPHVVSRTMCATAGAPLAAARAANREMLPE
jgi:hypothetical protein